MKTNLTILGLLIPEGMLGMCVKICTVSSYSFKGYATQPHLIYRTGFVLSFSKDKASSRCMDGANEIRFNVLSVIDTVY